MEIINKEIEELFEEAKHTKAKFHLTAEEMDILNEEESIQKI